MILDYKDNLDMPETIQKNVFNELQTLRNIWQGMCYLNRWTMEIERKANEKVSDESVFQSMPLEVRKAFEGKKVRCFASGNTPGFEWLDKGLIYSLFQWYAVSACNFVLLVGYLRQQADSGLEKPRSYLETVIPMLVWFRDKIAAHPVRACKDTRDNEVDRISSVLYPIAFDKERFYAPAWKLTIGQNGRQTKGTNPGPWSITETHEILYNRYRDLINASIRP